MKQAKEEGPHKNRALHLAQSDRVDVTLWLYMKFVRTNGMYIINFFTAASQKGKRLSAARQILKHFTDVFPQEHAPAILSL